MKIVNTGGFAVLKFTIDGHKLWVYAVDGHYVVPQKSDQVIVNNGERYSVLVELNQAPADYAIRVANQGLNQIISGFGIFSYKGATGPASSDPNALSTMNHAGINTTLLVPFIDKKAVPYPPVKVSPTADVTFSFDVKKLGRPYSSYEWTLTGTEGYNVTRDDESPLLFQKPKNIATDPLIIRTLMGQWVDLIIKVVGPLAQPHPMHKHSNKAFVIGSGIGNFTFKTVAEAAAVMPNGTFNFVNPPCKYRFSRTILFVLTRPQTEMVTLPHQPRAILRGWLSVTMSRTLVPSSSTATCRHIWAAVWQLPCLMARTSGQSCLMHTSRVLASVPSLIRPARRTQINLNKLDPWRIKRRISCNYG